MPEGALLDRLSSCCGTVVGSNCFVIRFLLLAMMGAGVTGYDAKWLDASRVVTPTATRYIRQPHSPIPASHFECIWT